jgi:hypothetical protein
MLAQRSPQPFVEIYLKGAPVGVECFKRSFYIVETLSGDILWHAGEQKDSRRGEIKVWIQQADTSPRILYVLPDWQVFINGVEQESRFYDSIENLNGQVVELRYREYQFVFHFGCQVS